MSMGNIPRLSLGTSPLAVPLRRNAHYILTSIPVGEVLSIFRPRLMCPGALTVELRITTGSRVRVSRFKNWIILLTKYVWRNFRRERVFPLPIESLELLCR